MKQEEGFFVNSRGQRLRDMKYIPEKIEAVQGVLLFLGGYREHLGRKVLLLSQIAKAGYAVFHLEAHGHGKSEPHDPPHVRFTTESIFHYVDDFLQYLREVVRQYPLVKEKGDLPIFVGGMSMGGQVATLAAIQAQAEFNGMVLISPAIDVDRNWIMSIQEVVAELLMMVVPYARIVPAVTTDSVTLERDVQESIESDELMEKGPVAVKQAYNMLQGFKYIATHEHELSLPILVSVGEEDAVVSMKAIQRFLNNVQTKDATLDIISGGYHALDQGMHGKQLVNSIVDWLEERCG